MRFYARLSRLFHSNPPQRKRKAQRSATQIELLEQRLVLSGQGLLDAGLDLEVCGQYAHDLGLNGDHSHANLDGGEGDDEGHGPGCNCGACCGGGLHGDGPEPHLLFAPDTSQTYIDQFQHNHGDNEIGEFQLNDRFTSTASNGGGISLGESITVTWSIVRDGVNVNGFAGEASSPSNLVSTFRGIYGIAHNPADTDYQGEAWFEAIESGFDRWSEVSGINYVYEPNDDGANFVGASGSVGVRGDVRIAGHRIDGNSGTLAYNFYPNTSDMVIDTADSFYTNTSNNSLRLRNVIAHEAGHGFGLAHVSSNNGQFLMEPFINLGFDGPQLDDILGAHRGYGDAFEQNGGNDTAGNATGLGIINNGQTITIGDDADDTFVGANDTAFVSIDDDSDVDYFSFTVGANTELDAVLIPKGPTYNQGPQDGSQSAFNTAAQSNLTLQILDTNGSTILASANNTGIGGTESLNDIGLASGGTYYVRITGAQNAAQLYELSLTVNQNAPADPGVTITQSSGSTNVTEGGANDTYTIVLDSQPTSNVTVNIATGGEASTNFSSVTFTPSNWFTAQTVTVSAVNDARIEGNHSDTITHTVNSADPGYNGLSVGSVNVNITDNDSAGLIVTQTGGATNVVEGGATDSYSIRLTAQPENNVTVTIGHSGGQVTTSASQLIFTPTNWNVNQNVTVTAVNDQIAEGNHSATITHSTSSADSNFDGLSGPNVTANITDNDSAGVVITESGGSTNVSEDGTQDSYQIVLTSRPTGTVRVKINNADGELTTNTSFVEFTTTNWDVAQTVTVGAVDDSDVEGNHNGVLTHTVVSSDGNYNGRSVSNVTATITDNDAPPAGVTITQSGGATNVSEAGATDTYTVVLNSAPTADVVITLNSGSQLATNVSSLTFTPGNWNVAQTVQVSAVDDTDIEGDHTGQISHTAASADAAYDGIAIANITANIDDNDANSDYLNFNDFTVVSYGGNQDVTGDFNIEDGGTTLRLSGNTWKAIALPYNITPDTVLEFDFSSTDEGEIHGIGFDTNLSISSNLTFKVFGTQSWGRLNYDNYTTPDGTRRYTIPIGQFYTGNFNYLFFVNDHDVSNPSVESVFSNIEIYENVPVDTTGPRVINSSASGAASGTLDRFTVVFDEAIDPATLTTDAVTLSGPNGAITPTGINQIAADTYEITFASQSTTGTYELTIDPVVTDLAGNLMDQDDDGTGGEAGQDAFTDTAELTDSLNFNDFTILSYGGGQDVSQNHTVQDGGATLRLDGNTWKAIALPYTITANTVLEFDFSSTSEGEIHGIGFDSNLSLSSSLTFKVFGTQAWGRRNYDNYTPADGTRRYTIPVGQFYRGNASYLFFVNDHDVSNPSAVSLFSNVKIYENAPAGFSQGSPNDSGETARNGSDVIVRNTSANRPAQHRGSRLQLTTDGIGGLRQRASNDDATNKFDGTTRVADSNANRGTTAQRRGIATAIRKLRLGIADTANSNDAGKATKGDVLVAGIHDRLFMQFDNISSDLNRL